MKKQGDSVHVLVQKLDEFTKVIDSSKNAIGLYWRLFDLLNEHWKALKYVRFALDQCHGGCDKPASCLYNVYEKVSRIRDGLIETTNGTRGSLFFPSFVINILEEALCEWDELAEECAVSSDQEIRDLLGEIADVF
jgi:hypothetical protein